MSGLAVALSLQAVPALADSVAVQAVTVAKPPVFDWHANRADAAASRAAQVRLVRLARQAGLRGRGWNCSAAGSGSGSDCVLR